MNVDIDINIFYTALELSGMEALSHETNTECKLEPEQRILSILSQLCFFFFSSLFLWLSIPVLSGI